MTLPSVVWTTITESYGAQDGAGNITPAQGTVTFTPSRDTWITDVTDHEVLLPDPVVGVLDAAGLLSVQVLGNDDSALTPQGFTYDVVEDLTVGNTKFTRSYTIPVPSGGTVYLGSVAPVPPQGGGANRLVLSVAGVFPDTTGNVPLAAADVGALTQAQADALYAPIGVSAGVSSVNGKTGDVTLTASDVGALTQVQADARYSMCSQFKVTDWENARGARYCIAHRGSGDVIPENSMEAYEYAFAAGALAWEVSVRHTGDGVLVVMHDTSYDRTTDTTGDVGAYPSTILKSVHIDMPTQGAAWTGDGAPKVPYFADILDRFGGRVVMFVEAKDYTAYDPIIQMIEDRGLQDTVIIKGFYSDSHLADAKAAGYRTFAYFGAPGDITDSNIATYITGPGVDYVGIPAYDGDKKTFLADSLVTKCVNTGVPVLAYPVHRRSDAAHYFDLGAAGVITPSVGYVASAVASTKQDSWWSQALAPGEMTVDPSTYGMGWVAPDELEIYLPSRQAFLTLGQFCPLADAAGSYTITFEACWTVAAVDQSSQMILAFGCYDDTYYEYYSGRGSGYDAVCRPDGSVQVYSRVDGTAGRTQLGSTVATAAAVVGQWMSFQLDVTPSQITWTRTDVAAPNSVSVANSTYRGGYLHLGITEYQGGKLAVRNLKVA